MPAQDKGEYEGVPRELLLKKIESLQQENSRLKEADKKFHLLFNRINDVVFVYHLTPKGPEPFLEINDRACTRYGYSREELLTMTFKDLGIKENFVNLPDLIQKLKRKKY
ncbi:MAG: hypothetical protein GY757_23840, partial [bacterium]|nr:hypothetical protein [bacterium]